jgi:mono/diheme cytochrome c family protein
MTELVSPLARRLAGSIGRLVVLCLVLIPSAACASLSDVRITEIYTGPAPGAAGGQWVELLNAGAEPVDLSGAWVGAESGDSRQLTGLAPVPPSGMVVIHWNANPGVVSADSSMGSVRHDFFTGPAADLSADRGCLILSRASDPLNAAAMLAYVQWGAAHQRGAEAANSLNLWPQDRFLPSIPPGHSLALAPGGLPSSPTGWVDAVTPTPGTFNTGPVSAWRGWRLVGVSAMAPAAVSDTEATGLDAIGISALGSPVHYRFRDDTWTAGISLPVTTQVPVGLATSGDGSLDLALTAPDGAILYQRFASGQWSPAMTLGRGASMPPALAYNPAAKELEMVIADATGQLQFARAVKGAWSAWSPIGAAAGPIPPALAINILDRPFDVLFAGLDGMLTDSHFDAGTWSPPVSSAGPTAFRPAVAVTGANTVEVVVTGPDHKVYHNRLEDGVWAGWVWTGLESDTAPALLSSPTDNGLELFVTGRDGLLYHSRLINDVWGTPWPLGALSGQPAAAAVGPDGGLELLMAGADGHLWHNRFRPASPDLTSLSGKVQQIFDAHCIQCHDTGDPESDQNLEEDASYSSTVQVPAKEIPFMHRIEPGSPENSYLFHKITGTQASVGGSGERMPRGGQLSDAEIQTIRAWIAQGALDN